MKMVRLIVGEYIKGRHSFGRRSVVIFPLLTTLMAVFLMGGQLTQVGAYNWWYMLFLPMVVSMISINLVNIDKKLAFFNIDILPVTRSNIWMAKILAGCSYILVANTLLFGLTTVSGIIFGSQYSNLNGIFAGIVLTISWLWQIPLGMFLVAKFNSTFAFLTLISLNIIFSIQDIAGGDYWFIPFSIPARLMAPIIGVNPNGIPLTSVSSLHDSGVILPGILITLFLFLVGGIMTIRWFSKEGGIIK